MLKKIVIIQRRMTHYRVAFFESLRTQMAERNFQLVLGYGVGTVAEQGKRDAADIEWARKLPTRYFFGGRICYQPLKDICDDTALLIVTSENKLICNLWHQFTPVPYKVALWGHGANLQGKSTSWREKFKRRVARRADWWFGYTEHSRPLIARTGFPGDRITVLNNAVDTADMLEQFENIDPAALSDWRISHGIGQGLIGIFLGSLYEEKRVDFLLEAAKKIQSQIPGFELLLVGAGPQKAMVEAFCAQHPWAHYAGVLKGYDKVQALACASVMLNPGLVGLGILDSFVCEVPMVTTDCGLHSPEIVYLQSGTNGLMTKNTQEDYVRESVALLHDPARLLTMKQACRSSATVYTVENMARNFADGVEQCLLRP